MNLLDLKFTKIPIREIYVTSKIKYDTNNICICDFLLIPHYHGDLKVIQSPSLIIHSSEAAKYFISNYGYIPSTYKDSDWAQGHKIEG